MIPIGLPSYEFVFIRLGYFIATLVWIIWVLRLVFSRKARAQLRGWWLPAFCILTGTGIYSLWSAYAFNRGFAAYKAEVQDNYHPVLVEGQRLGGIDMPAGTVLKLGVARQMEAFDRAEFPHQVLVSGVHTMRVERYLSIQTDENFRTTGFTPENIRLTGVGESRQSGWVYDARVAIVFATYPNGRIKAFESCTAAAGNLIEGVPLPEGAGITSSQGQIYLDGRHGLDRWLIHLPENSGLQIRGTRQQGGAVLLDADRVVVEQVPNKISTAPGSMTEHAVVQDQERHCKRQALVSLASRPCRSVRTARGRWSALQVLPNGIAESCRSTCDAATPQLARNSLNAKGLPEPDPARRRDLERPCACAAPDPGLIQRMVADCSSQSARQMRTALTPVKTGATDRTVSARIVPVVQDAKRLHLRPTGCSRGGSIAVDFNRAADPQRIGDADPSAPARWS